MTVQATVVHDWYGCETGCCGHTVTFDDGTPKFVFDHPWGEDPKQWATDLVAMLAKERGITGPIELQWEGCEVSKD